MVADFWSSKVNREKYLGVRVYFIDANWVFRSVLLGTRHFNPTFQERQAGCQQPFMDWIKSLLLDYNLKIEDFWGSTSDAGPDVKWMMSEGLKLQWEWCFPHLVTAATKNAFGMVNDKTKSKNKDWTDIIGRISRTIYETKSLTTLDTLFQELNKLMGRGKKVQLVDYKPHRFMGLTKVLERTLGMWRELQDFYVAKYASEIRRGKAPTQGSQLEDV